MRTATSCSWWDGRHRLWLCLMAILEPKLLSNVGGLWLYQRCCSPAWGHLVICSSLLMVQRSMKACRHVQGYSMSPRALELLGWVTEELSETSQRQICADECSRQVQSVTPSRNPLSYAMSPRQALRINCRY